MPIKIDENVIGKRVRLIREATYSGGTNGGPRGSLGAIATIRSIDAQYHEICIDFERESVIPSPWYLTSDAVEGYNG